MQRPFFGMLAVNAAVRRNWRNLPVTRKVSDDAQVRRSSARRHLGSRQTTTFGKADIRLLRRIHRVLTRSDSVPYRTFGAAVGNRPAVIAWACGISPD